MLEKASGVAPPVTSRCASRRCNASHGETPRGAAERVHVRHELRPINPTGNSRDKSPRWHLKKCAPPQVTSRLGVNWPLFIISTIATIYLLKSLQALLAFYRIINLKKWIIVVVYLYLLTFNEFCNRRFKGTVSNGCRRDPFTKPTPSVHPSVRLSVCLSGFCHRCISR